MCCIAWRSATENPFMTTAERAAASLLPTLPPRKANAPGQFALADARRIREVLDAGGWRHVDARPVDMPCAMPEHELRNYLMRLGPVGALLSDADAATRKRVYETIRPAFDEYVLGGQVRFSAACWCVDATA